MRSAKLLASAFAALSAAAPAPAPQDIDFDLVYALPDPSYKTVLDQTVQVVTYTPSAIFESALPQITATTTAELSGATDAPQKRAVTACTALPTGAGPIPSPDTASAFLSFQDLSNVANAAVAPAGYTQTFTNLKASNNAYGYLGYITVKSYDVSSCAAKCNAIQGCSSFNIYYERAPSVEPGSGSSGCENPASTTLIKCAFWGGPINTANANNAGQWRNKFQVVIAGSNGYVSNAIASLPGYNTAVPLGNAAINAPYDIYGFSSYMGVAIFTDGPFNASLCAEACTKKSEYAVAHPPTDGTPVETCQFFNTYILYLKSPGQPKKVQGQYCAMYSESWPAKYATNVGQYSGNDQFLVEYSFSYTNSTSPGVADPKAAVYQGSKEISRETLQPFCSSYLGYTIPTTTQSVTATATSLTTTTTTSYTTITSYTAKLNARDSAEPTDVPESILSLMRMPAWTPTPEKRDLATPAVLTKYPTQILSSACSLQATPATSTVTITSMTTVTTAGPTSTSVVVSTSIAAVPITTFKMKISAPGTRYDGAYVSNSDQNYIYLGLTTDSSQPQSGNIWKLDTATGFIKSAAGWYFARDYLYNEKIAPLGTDDGADTYAPNACSIDSATLQLRCSTTKTKPIVSTFYVVSNGLLQIALGSADATGYVYSGTMGAVPVSVYAEPV